MDDLDLTEFFNTKAESVDFLARLSSISEEIYGTDFNLDKALLDQFGIKKKAVFNTLLRVNKIKINSNAALEDFFEKIREKVSSLPVLSLTLAVEPDEKMLKKLSGWFPVNINRQVLFDIQVDPDIIAGAAVAYNGKYADFSQKPVYKEVLNETLSDKGLN